MFSALADIKSKYRLNFENVGDIALVDSLFDKKQADLSH